MFHKVIRIFSFILSGTFIIFSSAFASDDLWKTQFQSALNQWRIKNHIPGVSIAIEFNNKTDFFSSGSASLNDKQSLEQDTLFGVGSITKTFISVLILKEISIGKLSLNEKIGDFFPSLPRWKNITIKQLLDMESGINNFYADPKYLKDIRNNVHSNWTSEKLISLSYSTKDNFKPGEKWEYSNTNYLLLGKILEKITHKKLSTLLKDKILKPQHLSNTFYSETNYSKNIRMKMAHGYYNNLDITSIKPSNYGAAGSMFMNTTDLLNWTNDLFVNKNVLSNSQIHQMLSGNKIPNNNIRPNDTSYGLGIYTTQTKKFGKMIWYVGVIQGYTSSFLYLPKEKIVIVAQINRWYTGNMTFLFPNKELMVSTLDMLEKINK